MTTTLKVDAAGRIALPDALRTEAGWTPGETLVAEIRPEGLLLKPAGAPIWQSIAAAAQGLSSDLAAALPTDGAAQHDHYIQGTPKRPE